MLSRDVSLLVARSEKNIPVGCQEQCLYLMWNDTYMTAKSEHNCSLNNKKKCSQCLHQHLSFQFPLSFYLNFCLSFTIKLVMEFSYKSTNKCWSQMLISNVDVRCWCQMLCHLFYSLEDVQFQFGLNAFAYSLRMVGQCVSGQTKM